MGEVGATVDFHNEPDVGGVGIVFAGGDGADVAVLEVGLSGAGFFFGDVVNGKVGDTGFDFAHGSDE